MTEKDFEQFRERCPDCCIKRDPITLDRTFTCYKHDGVSYGRECCVEICPKCTYTRDEGVETTHLDRGVTAHTIHKIIDDAMEKKDRRVNILMSEYGVTIGVEPISKTKPRWKIMRYKARRPEYACSECGVASKDLLPYCPYCGEKLACPSEEDINTLTNSRNTSDFESLKNYFTEKESKDD